MQDLLLEIRKILFILPELTPAISTSQEKGSILGSSIDNFQFSFSSSFKDLRRRVEDTFRDLPWKMDPRTKRSLGRCVHLLIASRFSATKRLPLLSLIFSHTSRSFVSMNRTIIDFVAQLADLLNGRGIWLFDRGFDSRILILQKLLKTVVYPFSMTIPIYKRPTRIRFGFSQIRIPGIETPLWVVYTSGTHDPLILLTNEPISSEKEARRMIRLYASRWSVEEGFRDFKVKKSSRSWFT